MSNPDRFTEIQYAFTRHMRDPEHAPAPADIEDRRVEIYRGLLYRNVEGFMANSYPVLRKITEDDNWHAMIRDYFKRHESHTPYFPKMPREFLDYLEHERNVAADPPFLFELAHYEWMETTVAIDPREIDYSGIDR
ncbi:MAG: DNA-binding domain-containing protein, partial [Pirellulales bacterium]|nr:DNA-binding domain-containing protein [Pirellulales bacterium]